MRKLMEESGIKKVILISLAALVFLPKNIALWITAVAFVLWTVIKVSAFYRGHRNKAYEIKEKIKIGVKQKRKSSTMTETLFNYTLIQLAYRITDKLHMNFPDATWCWRIRPDIRMFAEGGIVKIAVNNADEFNEADVILDAYGRMDIKMLKTECDLEIVKESDDKLIDDYTVNAETWYAHCGQKVLTDIITELNARGTKVLCIKKDGRITVNDDKQIGALDAFPDKRIWGKLVHIFQENGLMAIENEDCIELGW